MKTTSCLILVLVTMCNAQLCLADWVAGRDMKANEVPNGSEANPNTTVPEWSYGGRTNIADVTFNLSPTHTNARLGFANFEGWEGAEGAITVNTGNTPIMQNFGLGPLGPVNPSEIATHPTTGRATVIRWTAPYVAIFSLSGYWHDIDPNGGNGVSGDVVLNGLSLFHQDMNNGGSASFSLPALALLAGDKVDFVVGTRGDFNFDSTTFDATITAVVPEPASIALLIAGATLLVSSRCLSRIKARPTSTG